MFKFDVKALKILVVEDNAHFRNLIKTILEALGVHEIAEARDGDEGLETLRGFRADLAILDWKMDHMDGVEFIQRVRRSPDSPDRFLPIIMVTGYSEAKLMRAARDAGVNEFLAKPISARSLLSRIVDVLENPRPFVETEDYFGPDRRRKQAPFDGAERRRRQSDLIEVPPRSAAAAETE